MTNWTVQNDGWLVLFGYSSSICTWAVWFQHLQLVLYNRTPPPFCSLTAFTGRLSGSSKGYTDVEKYKAEAQNLGMLVSIWLNWLAIKTCKQQFLLSQSHSTITTGMPWKFQAILQLNSKQLNLHAAGQDLEVATRLYVRLASKVWKNK